MQHANIRFGLKVHLPLVFHRSVCSDTDLQFTPKFYGCCSFCIPYTRSDLYLSLKLIWCDDHLCLHLRFEFSTNVSQILYVWRELDSGGTRPGSLSLAIKSLQILESVGSFVAGVWAAARCIQECRNGRASETASERARIAEGRHLAQAKNKSFILACQMRRIAVRKGHIFSSCKSESRCIWNY